MYTYKMVRCRYGTQEKMHGYLYIHNNHIVNGSGDEMKMFNGVNESRNYLFIQSAKGENFFFYYYSRLMGII